MVQPYARHATRPEARRFSTTDMQSWFVPNDHLNVAGEIVSPFRHGQHTNRVRLLEGLTRYGEALYRVDRRESGQNRKDP